MSKQVKEKNIVREGNKTVSMELLISYRKALYRIKEYFDSVENFDMNEDIDKTMKVVASILKSGSELGKAFESLVVLEKKVQAEELEKSRVRGGAKLSLLEEGDL